MAPATLRQIREALKLTQGEMAERVGVGRWLYNAWETGRKPIKKHNENAIRHVASLIPQTA